MRRTLNICENVFKNENLIQNVIVPEIVNILGHVYPELVKKCNNIKEIFIYENEHYKSLRIKNRKEFHALNIPPNDNLTEEDTIDFAGFSNGYRDVNKLVDSNSAIESLPVDFIYDRLYVNFGLSEELIEKIAAEKNLVIDMDEFAEHKRIKKLEAKLNRQKINTTLLDSITLSNAPKTDYGYMYDYSFDPKMQQYHVKSIRATVNIVQSCNDIHHIVLDRTNFYHTAGGQDGDIGKIVDSNGIVFNVDGVEFHKGYVIHSGRFHNATDVFKINQNVSLHVDSAHRTGLSQHHTAMHLLQAAMKHVTGQIIFQQSSHVTSKQLKCDLGSIGKRIDIVQLSQAEELVRNMIQAKLPIETEFLMAHDLYALNNVTTVPGEIYPDENIRVLKITNEINHFVSIEPCCGTHAQNTNELIDFCITSFKFNGNIRSYDVAAVAGHSVTKAKENEQNFLSKYEPFKSKICEYHSIEEWKIIDAEAVELANELIENQMPYITKATISLELDKIQKDIHHAQRAQIREDILSEMVNVLNRRDQRAEAFIIHVLNTKEPLEETLMADAERVCHDLPVIILNVSNDKIIHGRACIPIKYTTNKFNAKYWIQELANVLNIKCQANKKKKQFAICSFSEIPNREFSSTQLKTALEKATIVAQEAFTDLVLADHTERISQEGNLIARIDGVRQQLKNENNVNSLIELDTQSKGIRNDMKNNLYLYTTKIKCMAELTCLDEEIYGTRLKIEKYVQLLEM